MQVTQGDNARVLDETASVLAKAKRLLFVTGAGLSADSGLPTYRGVGGLYEGMGTEEGLAIESLLSGNTLSRRPELVWKYLREVERTCRGARFNAGHRVIAAMERRVEHVVVLTQNVDGLHTQAGSTNVIEIHGDFRDLFCQVCKRRRRVRNYISLAAVPRCSECNGVERPDVVLFGETLPEAKMDRLMGELAVDFDAVISVGTGGRFPYIRLPLIRAQTHGWFSLDINPGDNAMAGWAKHRLVMGASEACEALWDRLR